MALEYGINFNTEKGLKQAQDDIKKWHKEFQSYLKANPLDINIGGKEGKGGGKKGGTAQLQGYRKELQELRNAYRALTVEELKNGNGQALIDKYNKLKSEVGLYGGTLDQSAKALSRLKAETEKTTPATERQTKAFRKQSGALQDLRTYAMNFLSVYAGIRMIKNMVEITGEFEMQAVSMKAILMDAEKGAAIFERIKELAVISPFQFKDLISYAKQLSAFSVPYEELYDSTKMLADLSAGLGVGMDRLILAYGQVRAASVLRGQELRQFTEAGIPLVEELRRKFEELNGEAVTAGQVFEFISERKVPFEMVKDIIVELTSEGGKFYKMQEKQADTLKGKIANLKDAADIAMASLGEKDGGILKGTVDSVRWAIESYEFLGKAILTVAAVTGIYTTAVKLKNIATFAEISLQGASTAATLRNIVVTKTATVAQKALNAAMAVNPYVAVAMLLTAVGGALWALSDGLTAAERAQERFNKTQEENRALLEEQKSKLNGLLNVIKDDVSTTRDKHKALKELQDLYPSIFADLDMEAAKHLNNADAIREANIALQEKADLQDNQRLSDAKALLESKKESIRWSMDERGKALSLMGRDDTYSNRVNFFSSGMLKEFEEYIKLSEKARDDAYKADEDARYNALGIEEKIKAKREENEVLAKRQVAMLERRGNTNLAADRRAIDDQIDKEEKQMLLNQKIIKELQAELDKPKRTMALALQELDKWQKILIENQKKLAGGSEDKESVLEAEDKLSKIKEELALMGWNEPTKGSKKTATDDTQQRLDAIYAQERMEKKLAFERQKFNLELKEANDKRTLEGYDLELELIKNQYEREQIAIKEREDSLIESNIAIARKKWESEGKVGAFKSEGSLSTIDDIEIRKREEEANAEQLYAKQELYKKLIKEYRDYAGKIEDIEKTLAENVRILNLGRDVNGGLATDRAIKQARENAAKEISSLQFDELKNSEAWKMLFSDLENYTVKTLKDGLSEIEKSDTSSLNPADAKALQQAVDKIKKQIGIKDPFYGIREGWKKMVKGFEENNTDRAVEGMNEMTASAQQLNDAIGALQGITDSIFGVDSDASTAVTAAAGAAAATMDLADAAAKFAAKDYIGGAISLAKAAAGYINVFRTIRNKKHNNEIKRQAEIVHNLEVQYNNLADSMEKALGKDYYDNAKKQSENLKKQAESLQKMIDAENKKGKDTDKEKIKQLEQQRQDALKESVKVVEGALEKLTGTNLTSAAEDFAKSWIDAYVSFGNTTDAMKDKFQDMMRNMVVNAMLVKVAEEALKPVFESIEKAWKDGDLTMDEIVDIANKTDIAATKSDEGMKAIMEMLELRGLDLKNKGETNLTGISKGVAGLSEDTALILGGLLDSIRYRMFNYFDLMSSPENLGAMAMLVQTQNNMINYLQSIEINTKVSSDNSVKVVDMLAKVISTDGNRGAYALNVNS